MRCFEDDNVTHVEGDPDPARDIEIVAIELALADLATMRKRIPKLEREVRANPKLRESFEAAQRLDGGAGRGAPGARVSRRIAWRPRWPPSRSCSPRSPLLYVANVDESADRQAGRRWWRPSRGRRAEGRPRGRALRARSRPSWPVSRRTRRASSARELGLERSGLDELAVAAYDLLGLMTFLTAGEKEVRAWTIPARHQGARGRRTGSTATSSAASSAPRSCRTTTTSQYRTMEALRAAGRVRSEGREYVMHEGDVVNFRFNV